MELIYTYIKNYRTFENQQISFSNKFSVIYDQENIMLSISENKNYFNLYPDNIVNISGILGKNASGKTSLLSLIGSKIDERHRGHEIFANDEKDPHKKFQLHSLEKSSEIDNIQYNSSYFLIYYLGRDENGSLSFIFETNTPQKYIRIFENSEEWTKNQKTYGRRLDYYICKGWFSGVFLMEKDKYKLINDTQNYPNLNYNIQDDVAIINFQRSTYIHKFEIAQSFDEEPKISIKRRPASLQSIFLKPQVKFLHKQMNLTLSNMQMFCNDKYTIDIQFASKMPSNETFSLDGVNYEILNAVTDYRDFNIQLMDDKEKIMLAFLNEYVWYLITLGIYSYGNVNENQKKQIAELYSIQAKSDSYFDIKNMYHEKIEYVLDTFDNDDLTLTEFLRVEKALEFFLDNAKKYKIDFSYITNHLLIEISKDSNLDAVDPLFKDFIDENMHKNLAKEDSVLFNFLETDIQWLSDGEKENLSLFASIDEQISQSPRKKKYIFLFDEIERSMHPDLCRRLIADLIDYLGQYSEKQFQIILSSHSPFISSDLLGGNIVYLQRNHSNSVVINGQNIHEKPFAQNIHTILKSQFFLDAFMGEYAIRCIRLVLECIDLGTDERAIVNKINAFLNNGTIRYGKGKIECIEDARKFIEYIIQSIGEKLIQNELTCRFKKLK